MKPLGAKAQGRSGPRATPADERQPPSVTHLRVTEDGEGQRLDNHLVRVLKGVPRAWIWRVIRTGEVRVNGRRVDVHARLGAGDDIRIPPVRRAESAVPPGLAQARRSLEDLTILHEDPAWLILDKPAGLAVHGGSGVAAGLIERLRAARPDDRFLELAHRIDRETSGLLIVARSRKALLSLHRQFAEGVPRKHYRALVAGRWARPGMTPLRFPLERLEAANGDRRVRVAAGGAPAETRVTLLSHRPGDPGRGQPAWFSLLDCHLLTGRTHQIRVHLSHTGFPIVGDPKYGDFTLNKILQKQGYNRMFLHAFSISLDHPIEGRRVQFEAPLPAAFQRVIEGVARDTTAGSANTATDATNVDSPVNGGRRAGAGGGGHS